MTFAEALRALMAERGVGVRALARRVYCDHALISRYAAGKEPPSRKMARLIDMALSAEGKLAGLVPVSAVWRSAGLNGAFSPDDEDRLIIAARAPSRIDAQAVESLAVILAAQRRAEDLLGSARVAGPVAAQLAVVERLVADARGPVRPAVVHVAGQWAQYAGWLSANTGKVAEGAARLSQALQWAVETGDPSLISEVLSFQGHLAWVAGKPGPLIGLSQAARRDPSAFPGQLAISCAQEAQGRAMTGDDSDVDRLLDQAGEYAAAAAERPEDSPPWLYYHSPGFFLLQRGLAYRYLAGDPRYRLLAVQALEAGHATLPAGERQSEWGAEYLCHLASAHARGEDLDRACAAAVHAAGIARETESPRLRAALRRLHAGLAARWPGEPGVTALRDALG